MDTNVLTLCAISLGLLGVIVVSLYGLLIELREMRYQRRAAENLDRWAARRLGGRAE